MIYLLSVFNNVERFYRRNSTDFLKHHYLIHYPVFIEYSSNYITIFISVITGHGVKEINVQ